MSDEDLLAVLADRLREIYRTAAVPYKLTGKMAYITGLSRECLDLIDGERRAGPP